MSEQTKVLMYSRDFLLSFSDHKRFDPSVYSVFKSSVETRSFNEKQVPSTVERSRNLRPEARKPEKFLTPNNPKGKWKAKDMSPDATSPTAKGSKPTTNRKTSIGDKDKQWRPNAMNKENVENSEGTPNLHTTKARTSQNIAKPTETNFGTLSKAESNTKAVELQYEEITVNLISPSPETPVSSPTSSKVAARTPGTPSDLSLSPGSPKTGSPKVIDEHQLEQRQKQIDYGHQTLGYLRYRLLVPKDKRSRDDPRTPKKTQACSKRSWDGQIKKMEKRSPPVGS